MKTVLHSLILFACLGALGTRTLADGFWGRGFHAPGLGGVAYAAATRGQDVVVGGEFLSADGLAVTNVARWDGTNWTALGGGVNGRVQAVALRGTDVFVAGSFTLAGGVSARRIARWDGSTWSALGSGIEGSRVTALAVDGSGMLYAGGEFTNAGGVAVANIARWDGTRWSALGAGLANGTFPAWVLTLAVRGTELFAGGFFTEAGSASASCIARWDGGSWSALGAGVDDRDYLPQVAALALAGAELYVAGAFTLAGNGTANHVAKWTGSAWSALGSGLTRFFGDVPVTAIAVSGGQLFVGGRFEEAGGLAATNVARWDGSAWSAVGAGASGTVNALVAAGTNLYVGGSMSVTNAPSIQGLLSWNGARWQGASAGGGLGLEGTRSCAAGCVGDEVSALLEIGDVVYAAGGFRQAGGTDAANVASWDGTTWRPLAGGIAGSVFALAAVDGGLVAGGRFDSASGTPAMNIARWNGTAWSALGQGLSGPVHALVVSGGHVYAGGAFASSGATAASNLARWDGVAWSALGSGVNGPVYALALGDGSVFAGGRFTSAGGVVASNVARWNGSNWAPLGSGMSGVANSIVRVRPPPVSALAWDGQGLFVGGDFAVAGGVLATNIARWDGASWSALGSGVAGLTAFAPPPAVRALAWRDGRLVVGGAFTRAGDVPASNIALWDGVAWNVLGAGITTGVLSPPSVQALVWRGGGLVVGGHFKFAGAAPASDFAMWQTAPQLRVNRQDLRMVISWPDPGAEYLLESVEDLRSTQWRPVSEPVVVEGGWRKVTIGPLPADRFYRLQR